MVLVRVPRIPTTVVLQKRAATKKPAPKKLVKVKAKVKGKAKAKKKR